MKYAKGDRVELRDSAIAAIVSTYESTRGYAVVEKPRTSTAMKIRYAGASTMTYTVGADTSTRGCVPGVTALNLIPSACAHGCSLSFWCRWQRRH
jgi:hypothetical protein